MAIEQLRHGDSTGGLRRSDATAMIGTNTGHPEAEDRVSVLRLLSFAGLSDSERLPCEGLREDTSSQAVSEFTLSRTGLQGVLVYDVRRFSQLGEIPTMWSG